MAQPWWVESVGEPPKTGKRLDAAQIRLRLDAVLNYYFRQGGKEALVAAPDVREDRWQKAHCPFHRDKKASASVNWGKSRFRCHACDISGDAIDLVIVMEMLDFRKAMEWIDNL